MQDEVSGLASWLQPQLSTLRTLQHVPGAAWKAAFCTCVLCRPSHAKFAAAHSDLAAVSNIQPCAACALQLRFQYPGLLNGPGLPGRPNQTRPEQRKVLWGPPQWSLL